MCEWTHILEDRFVVVDVIDSHDDLSRAAEGVRPTGGVIVRSSDIEDVLRSLKSGRWTPPQLDDAYTHTNRKKITYKVYFLLLSLKVVLSVALAQL